MNTSLDIIIHGVSHECAEASASAIVSEIKKLQMVIDRYNSEAETYRINRDAQHGTTAVSPLLTKYILQGMDYFRQTEGYFNIFGGEIYASLKHNNNPSPKIVGPRFRHPEEIIEINHNEGRLRFLQKGVSLDFGGIGKGIALDMAAEILNQMEIPHAFISFGGSSILTRGRHPHGPYWPFSFQDNTLDAEVWKLNNDAISVSAAHSGRTQKLHIWNHQQNQPIRQKIMACVQAECAADAEVLSTSLIAAPPDRHQHLTQQFQIKQWKVFNQNITGNA